MTRIFSETIASALDVDRGPARLWVYIYFCLIFFCFLKFILVYVYTWKRYGPKCYFVISYRRAFASSVSECQRHCAMDSSKCVQGHYLQPVCSLVSSTDYYTIGCSRQNYLVRKGKEFTFFIFHRRLPNIASNSLFSAIF